MHILPPYHRLLLLTEGRLGVFTSKTAAVLLRYRPDDCVGVIDSTAAGRDVHEFIPWGPRVPIFGSVTAAADLHADALVIGVAPEGGALPAAMRRHVCAALTAGIDLLSGLHTFLADDPEFADLARQSGAKIFDLRRPPANRVIAATRARTTRCRRVLTVGSDCSVGKMVAAFELTLAARRRGVDARFVATGQTGTLLAGRGITVDACIADFIAGAVEQLVLDAADCAVCFVEGQGSIAHPAYSGVTLALLHGACPDALVLVHQVGRTCLKAPPHDPLPSLDQLCAAYERLAGFLHPARVVAVALNSVGQTDEATQAAARQIEAELGLPAADPVRHGCDRLLDAVLTAFPEGIGNPPQA